jgi:hypothetical protein
MQKKILILIHLSDYFVYSVSSQSHTPLDSQSNPNTISDSLIAP